MAIKYSININQVAYESLGLQISLEAAAVMDTFQSAAGNTKFQSNTIKEGKLIYYWFSYDFIIEQLPLLFPRFIIDLNESEDDFKLRYKKYAKANLKRAIRMVDELCELGLITRKSDNKILGKPYIRLTELSNKIQILDNEEIAKLEKSNIKMGRSFGKKYNEKIEKPYTNLYKPTQDPIQICTSPLDESVQGSGETLYKSVHHSLCYSDSILEKESVSISTLAPDPDNQIDILTNNTKKLDALETKETESHNTEGAANFGLIDSSEKLKAKMMQLFEDEFFLNYFINNYSKKGFKKENIDCYCQNFALQFFKEKTLCSSSDSQLKDNLAIWSYIFAKENEDIEKARRIEERAKGIYASESKQPMVKTKFNDPTDKNNATNILKQMGNYRDK